MSARTAAEAVETFLTPHRRAIHCLTDAVLTIRGGFNPKHELNAATVNKGLPTRLHHAEATRFLVATIHYRHSSLADDRWAVKLAGYDFELLGHDEREIVVYHWHPGGPSSIVTPHLHVGRDAEQIASGLDKAHLPSGIIFLPQFVRTLINDFVIGPTREDWARVLVDAEEQIMRLEAEDS